MCRLITARIHPGSWWQKFFPREREMVSSVYKFKGLSDLETGSGPSQLAQVVGILERGELFFSKLTQLNDPFEYACFLDFTADLPTKVEFWGKNPETADALRLMSSAGQQQYIEDIERQQREWQNTPFRLRPDGIFCTSSGWENHVLWSHYAESHTGVSIEIDVEIIKTLAKHAPVIYLKEARKISFYGATADSELFSAFSTKFSDWSYEQEVRFFGGAGVAKISTNAVKSITLGVNARNSNWAGCARVIRIVQQALPQCRIFEIKRRVDTYEFFREELDRNTMVVG